MARAGKEKREIPIRGGYPVRHPHSFRNFPDVQPRLILPNPLTFRAIHVRSRWMGSYVIGRLDGPLLLVYASYEATSVLFITSVHLPYRNALRFLLFQRINELSQPVTCPVWTPKWNIFNKLPGIVDEAFDTVQVPREPAGRLEA